MLERRQLLVIFASIVACTSATLTIGSEEWDEVAWTEEKSFQVVMSWYSKRTELMNVRVIYLNNSNLVHRCSSKFISTIHEKGVSTVVTNHRLVKTKISALNGSKPYCQRRRNHGKRSISAPRRADVIVKKLLYENVAIFLIPDEATFFKFLEEHDTTWHINKPELTLIIIISEEDILCQESAATKFWKTSVKNLLRSIWSNYQILNVFLLAPCSPCIKDYLFSWDPFEARENGDKGALKRLKVTADDPGVHKAISKFLNNVKNMNGYPLRVSIFQRFPTVFINHEAVEYNNIAKVEDKDIERLEGLDSLVLKTIAMSMNCSVIPYSPSYDAEYGYQLKNGTFVGMIGDIISGRIDFAANGVYLKDYQTGSAAEFTVPIGWDSICIVIPRADLIPLWLQTFLGFTSLVWGLMLLNIIIYSLIRHMIQLILLEERPRHTLLILFIETSLIFVSSPRKLPRITSERTLLVFWMLCGEILTGAFQGTLYDSFTNPRRYHEANTLAELDESGIKIGTSSPNMKDIFGEDDTSETLTNLHRKIEISDNFESGTIDRTVSKKDIAAIERKNDLYLSMYTKLSDEQGNSLLHMIQECPRSYYLGYLVPSGAFHLRRTNVLLRRLFESGLTTYWYNSTVDSLILKHQYRIAKELYTRDQVVAYNFSNLQTSFIILICGLLLSTLVFIGEKIRFYYSTQKC